MSISNGRTEKLLRFFFGDSGDTLLPVSRISSPTSSSPFPSHVFWDKAGCGIFGFLGWHGGGGCDGVLITLTICGGGGAGLKHLWISQGNDDGDCGWILSMNRGGGYGDY